MGPAMLFRIQSSLEYIAIKTFVQACTDLLLSLVFNSWSKWTVSICQCCLFEANLLVIVSYKRYFTYKKFFYFDLFVSSQMSKYLSPVFSTLMVLITTQKAGLIVTISVEFPGKYLPQGEFSKWRAFHERWCLDRLEDANHLATNYPSKTAELQ